MNNEVKTWPIAKAVTTMVGFSASDLAKLAGIEDDVYVTKVEFVKGDEIYVTFSKLAI